MGSGSGRTYIRHSVDVPLEVRRAADGSQRERVGRNISFGGLAFTSEEPFEVGDVVDLTIPTVTPPFEARATVAWCRGEGERYLVGVRFHDPGDAFRSRMVQQVCAIEQYRSKVAREEGRKLTTREAAAEWIERYAGRFPDSVNG